MVPILVQAEERHAPTDAPWEHMRRDAHVQVCVILLQSGIALARVAGVETVLRGGFEEMIQRDGGRLLRLEDARDDPVELEPVLCVEREALRGWCRGVPGILGVRVHQAVEFGWLFRRALHSL